MDARKPPRIPPPALASSLTSPLATSDCKHEFVFSGLCGSCGADVSKLIVGGDMMKVMGWGMNQDGLLVSKERALLQARQVEGRLLKSRKLALIVDLDQTLIHTTVDPVAEAWASNGTPELFSFGLQGSPMRYYTKVRPGARAMLDHLNNKYEMHVFTFGTRQYALEILKFIDPTRKYFGERILSKDEAFDPRNKTLNLASLFPAGTHMVAIIDDTQPVWDYSESLVPAVPYVFFKNVEEVNAVFGRHDISREQAAFRRLCDIRLNVASRIEVPTILAEALREVAAFWAGADKEGSVDAGDPTNAHSTGHRISEAAINTVARAMGDALLAHAQNLCESDAASDEVLLINELCSVFLRAGIPMPPALNSRIPSLLKAWGRAIRLMFTETEEVWDDAHPAVGIGHDLAGDVSRAIDYVDVMLGGGRLTLALADSSTAAAGGLTWHEAANSISPGDPSSTTATAMAVSSPALSSSDITSSHREAFAPSAIPTPSPTPAPASSGSHHFKQPGRRPPLAASMPSVAQAFRFHLTFLHHSSSTQTDNDGPQAGYPIPYAARKFLFDALDCAHVKAEETHSLDHSFSSAQHGFSDVKGYFGPFLGHVQPGSVTPGNRDALMALVSRGRLHMAVVGLRILHFFSPRVIWSEVFPGFTDSASSDPAVEFELSGSRASSSSSELSTLMALARQAPQIYLRVGRQRAPVDGDSWLIPMQTILDEVHASFYNAVASEPNICHDPACSYRLANNLHFHPSGSGSETQVRML